MTAINPPRNFFRAPANGAAYIVASLGAFAAAAAPAAGAEFFVPQGASIQAAIDSAAAHVDADATITLGPGLFDQSFEIDATGKAITIVGAGPGQTILTGESVRRIGRIRENGAPVVVRGVTFRDGLLLPKSPHGDGSRGAALRVDATAAEIRDCVFEDNAIIVPETASPGQWVVGGGAVFVNSSLPVLILDCVFRRNSTTVDATFDVYAFGGALHMLVSAPVPRVIGCVFEDNVVHTAGQHAHALAVGGACLAGGADFDRCEFRNNRATGGYAAGGAVYNNYSSTGGAQGTSITNCLFAGNHAAGSFDGFGGAVAIATGTSSLRHCTTVANFASHKGGGVFSSATTQVFIENSIVTSNAAPTNKDVHHGVSLGHNIFGPAAGVQLSALHEADRFAIDPGFVHRAGGDFRLAPGSSAIDAARTDPDHHYDLTGGPRAVNDPATLPLGVALHTPAGAFISDIGAYEFVPEAPASACAPDLNGDGQTNSSDLALLLTAWGPCR